MVVEVREMLVELRLDWVMGQIQEKKFHCNLFVEVDL